LVFFIVLIMQYDKTVLKKFIFIGVGMIGLEIFFALIQYLSGGKLDSYLFSSQIVSVGNMALLGGNEQFWTAGSRVFATMGRYDILGSFLALGTLIVQLQMDKQRLQLLKDERWNGVDAKLLQMLLEATLLNVRNGRESFKIDSWKSLGDFAISYAQPNDAQLPVYQAQVTDLEDDLWMQAQDDYYSQEGWEIEAGSPGDNDYISDDE